MTISNIQSLINSIVSLASSTPPPPPPPPPPPSLPSSVGQTQNSGLQVPTSEPSSASTAIGQLVNALVDLVEKNPQAVNALVSALNQSGLLSASGASSSSLASTGGNGRAGTVPVVNQGGNTGSATTASNTYQTTGGTNNNSYQTTGATSGNTNLRFSSTTGGTTTQTPASGATAASFSPSTLLGYIQTELTPGADPTHSGPQYLSAWDPSTQQGKSNLTSFYNGIISAHDQFFPNVSISTFAKAVVANAAVESTLNPNLANGGLLQYSPFYFTQDFAQHGTSFGTLAPGGSFNSNGPGQQVEIWAWYTKNALVQGGTRPGEWGSSTNGGVQNTFGNLWPTWVGGPGNANGNMQNYVPTIEAYFDKLGSDSEFKQLQATQLSSKYTDTK